jgi:hypothetical protein
VAWWVAQVAHPPTSTAHLSSYHDEDGHEEQEHEEKPAVSERIRATAAHVGEKMHNTVTSAIDRTGLNWRTVREPCTSQDAMPMGVSCMQGFGGHPFRN